MLAQWQPQRANCFITQAHNKNLPKLAITLGTKKTIKIKANVTCQGLRKLKIDINKQKNLIQGLKELYDIYVTKSQWKKV